MRPWELFLRSPNGTTLTMETSDVEVDVLIRRVSWLIGSQPKDTRLCYDAKELKYGYGRKLSDYNVAHHSSLFVLGCVYGGVKPGEGMKIRKTQVKPLEGHITLTKEPDMISLDDDPNIMRAKMPCGHVIGTSSMTSYCHSLLSEGKFTFACPGTGCKEVWPYFLVRHVACLEEAELKTFEAKISENYMISTKGFQECPGCKTWCMRANKKEVRIRCVRCTKQNGKYYDFCWSCLREWNTPGINKCGYEDCTGLDPCLKYLNQCGTAKVIDVTCPAARACPMCGMLIQHNEMYCKSIVCPSANCRHKFCFLCLKKWPSCGDPYQGRCTPAPIQTVIPELMEVQGGSDGQGWSYTSYCVIM